MTAGASNAAKARMTRLEPNQSIDHQRVWADLLWSPAIALNLFGDLAGNMARAGRAIHAWWPNTPGTVSDIAFSHSPGWLDPLFLNSLRSFDALITLDLGDGTRGAIAVDVKYHEKTKAETPRPENRRRYLEVAERSGIFRRGAENTLLTRNDLAVMWLEHLLLQSMLQHKSGQWRWGVYVVVRSSGNVDYSDACARYVDLLADRSTFLSVTLEDLFRGRALPPRTAAALRERYIPR